MEKAEIAAKIAELKAAEAKAKGTPEGDIEADTWSAEYKSL